MTPTVAVAAAAKDDVRRDDDSDDSDSDGNDHSTAESISATANASPEDTHARSPDTAPVTPAMARNPFDPRVSHREAFPSFDDALTASAEHEHDSDSHTDASALIDDSNRFGIGTGDGDGGAKPVSLDWSIDTIAEMTPMAFSPLPEQLRAAHKQYTGGVSSDDDSRELTPSGTVTAATRAHFFDDETQYRVLQTPSPLIRQQQAAQRASHRERSSQHGQSPSPSPLRPATAAQPPPTPTSTRTPPLATAAALRSSRKLLGGSSARDLHSRCQDAIAFFEDRLRERQRKLSRLQLPHSQSQPQPLSRSSATPPPPSARNKRRHRGDSEFPWKTPPASVSELKGIHPRANASGGSRPRGVAEPSKSPFTVPLTPITRTARMTVTPAACVPTASVHRAAAGGMREPSFSFDGGSPLSPIVPRSAVATMRSESDRRADRADAYSGNEPLSPIPRHRSLVGDLSGVATPSFESPAGAASDDRDKENSIRQQQARSGSDLRATSSSPSASLSAALSTPSPWGRAAENGLSLKTLAMLHHSTPSPLQSQSQSQPPSPSIAQRQESFMAAIEASVVPTSSAESASPRE